MKSEYWYQGYCEAMVHCHSSFINVLTILAPWAANNAVCLCDNTLAKLESDCVGCFSACESDCYFSDEVKCMV